MQLANDLPALHALGADAMGVSVDTPERNAGMRERWHLPFPVVSDPVGQNILRPLDLWDPDERGGVGLAAVVVFDRNGDEVTRLRARDYADRPADNADVFATVRALHLPPLTDVADWVPEVAAVDDPDAFRPDAYSAYFRGMRSATRSLASRMVDDADRADATALGDMATAYLDAWNALRETP